MNEEEKILSPEEAPGIIAEELPTEPCDTPEEAAPEIEEEEIPAQEPAAEEAPAEPAAEEAPAAPVHPAAPAEKAKKKRKKPHFLLRMLLQLISLALSLVLIVGVVLCVVLADVRLLTSKEGIKQIIGTMFERPNTLNPGMAAAGMGISTAPSGGSTSTSDMLIDFVLDTLEGQYGDELAVSRDQVDTFLEQSTIKEFVADKVASYTVDILTGELSTMITTEEVQDLINENKDLVQEHFGVEITDEMVQELVDYVEEQDINTVIREEVLGPLVDGSGESSGVLGGILGGGSGSNSAGLGGVLGGGATVVIPDLERIEEQLPELPILDILTMIPGLEDLPELPTASDFAEGVPVNVLLNVLSAYTSQAVLNVAIGFCVVLIILLLLCNFYNIPGGLGWSAFPCILVGGLLSIPTYIFLNSPDLADSLLGSIPMLGDAVLALVKLMSQVHYGVLFAGLGLSALSLGWRIVRAILRSVQRRRAEALQFA